MDEPLSRADATDQVATEPGLQGDNRAGRARTLRLLACVTLLAGALIIWNGWLWVEVGTGIAIVIAALVLFWGRERALPFILPLGRVYLLVFLPLLFWPWWQLRIWEAPWPTVTDWIRREALAHVLILCVLGMTEMTRWSLRLPLRPLWTAGLLLASLVFLIAQRLPAYRARAEIDPVAREQARRFVEKFHEDPDFSSRSGWWDEEPWAALKATPAWERPVMRCAYISWQDGMSMGDWGIGPWFHHPRYGQPKGILEYSFRDGSHWRGVEVEETITMPSGERVRLTMEMRISHSPPTGPPDTDSLSVPELFPEH